MDEACGTVGPLLPELAVGARGLGDGRLPHRLRTLEGAVQGVGGLPLRQQRDHVQQALEIGGRLVAGGAGDGEDVLVGPARFEVDREGVVAGRRLPERLGALGHRALAQAQALRGVGDVDAGAEGARALEPEALDPGGGAAAAPGGIDHEVAVQLVDLPAAELHAGHGALVVAGQESADGALDRLDAGQGEHAAAHHALEDGAGEPQGAGLVDARGGGGLAGPERAVGRCRGTRVRRRLVEHSVRLAGGPRDGAGGEELLAQARQELLHPRLAEGEQAVDGPALGHAAAWGEGVGPVDRQRVAVDDRDAGAVRGEGRGGEQSGHAPAHHDRVLESRHGLPPAGRGRRVPATVPPSQAR